MRGPLPGADHGPAPIEVVAAVIRRADGAVLLSLRRPEQHQGGLWEFPGGKQSPEESPLSALTRELQEELGIRIAPARVRPLVQLTHHYPDKSVRLTVWEIFDWVGMPAGREGQQIAWVMPQALGELAFPAANYRILAAATLPRVCLVTPEPDPADTASFLNALEASLSGGIRLVQLRTKSLSQADLLPLAQAVVARCHQHGARVLINAPASLPAALLEDLGVDGLHLPSRVLHQYRERPVQRGQLLSAACHDVEDIHHASRLGVDLGLLGPVLPTSSHPGQPGLGWDVAAALARHADFPLFALGGQGPQTVDAALAAGFHGLAAITALWNQREPPDARLRGGY
ncbi:MAG: hypothetical protein RL434_2986 [Pseudomonadota bacterium]